MSEREEGVIEFIRCQAPFYAKAKAERVFLDEFRKSKKAMLIQEAPESCTTAQSRDAYAYSHQDYIAVLRGLRVAVEQEETLRYQIKAAELKFEQWRTQAANNRAERQRYGA